MAQPTLVILAAGAGSRYGGLKQLAAVGPGGEALLEYSVYDALGAGFGRVLLVVQPEAEATFHGRLEAMVASVPVAFVRQSLSGHTALGNKVARRVKPWGTGHAVLAVEEQIEGPFVVINADDFYGRESFEVLARFLAARRHGQCATFAVVGFELERTLSEAGPVSRALCVLEESGLLREIREIEQIWRRGDQIVCRGTGGAEVTLRPDELVSMNMWGFGVELFAQLRPQFERFLADGYREQAEFLLPEVVQAQLREKKVKIELLRGSDRWYGITFREDEPRVAAALSKLVADGYYPQNLWKDR